MYIMDTKEVVIDDETMDMLKEVSERNGRSMDEEIQKYIYYITVGRKKIAEMGDMSPSLAALCSLRVKVPDNYDWREVAEEERNKKYMR